VRILVTGGSGFIGTNLIDLLLSKGYNVLNIDIKTPRNISHNEYWVELDILNKEILEETVLSFNPDYIVHLAARTDLNETKSINGYNVNIEGVENLMNISSKIKSLKRILVASSMLVCKLGYIPSNFCDYYPTTLYGKSKVKTEEIVKKYDIDWVIVRPTSIWGPWFAEPYFDFFKMVMNGYYINLPKSKASLKTYGYVVNVASQIYNILISNHKDVKQNYFYLGDKMPINITDWSNVIRILENKKKLITIPIVILRLAAYFGDILNTLFRLKFPINSFRFKNMTTNNVIKDLDRTFNVVDSINEINLIDATRETINWINGRMKY
jgi:nucleoside-diphosphate-sugar epimerase